MRMLAIMSVIGATLLATMAAGCASSHSPSAQTQHASDLGVIARVDAPAEVAAVRTFYVAPNDQPSMRDSFTVGTPLAQAIADRIATKLTSRGLTQGPGDMADATVTFSVTDSPAATTAPSAAGPTQGLDYADQLLNEAKAMQGGSSFLQRDRLDLRINMISGKTRAVIWRGSVAGVLPADEGPQGRLVEVLDGVDRLIDKYPKVK